MTTTGKALRWNRFLYPGSRFGLIVPIDHGLTMGPIDGLTSVAGMGTWLRHPRITGIVAHKGVLERLAAQGWLGHKGLMLHLNGMSNMASAPDRKQMLTGVETALRLGADGVSLQLNFDGSNDGDNLTSLGATVDQAQQRGLPVLVMVYDKVTAADREASVKRIRHLMRIAIELGADAVKIGAPEKDARRELPLILDGISDDIAVFVAGGALRSDEEMLSLTRLARRSGAAGLCVGRNVFQRAMPEEILTKLGDILLGSDQVRRQPVWLHA
ncbi:MAG: aldolase [Proteobacteria bacterium]|nr:aldolase [Pseudomonadota bacterium]